MPERLTSQSATDFNRWLILKYRSKATRRAYGRIATEFVKFCIDNNEYRYSRFSSPNVVFDFLLKTTKKPSVSSILLKEASINAFLKWFAQSIDKGFKKIKTRRKTICRNPFFLDEKKMMVMLQKLQQVHSYRGKRNYAMILTLYATGLRISELVSIEHKDIISDWIFVRGKGDVERVVPFIDMVRDAIFAYTRHPCYPKRKNKFVWQSCRAKPMSADTARWIVKKETGFNPHAFRHTFATHLIWNDCDLLVIKELLGHSSLNTTKIYLHNKRSHLFECVQKYHPLSKEKILSIADSKRQL